MKKTQRKKMHHFIPVGYLDAWRSTNRIFVLNLSTGHTFESTGRNSVAAISGFNDFSFNADVMELINYTFLERAIGENNAYNTMLKFISFMKDFDYDNKKENLLEDFYSQIEGRISQALRSVFHGDLQVISQDLKVFDDLIVLYCLQMMRTKKARKRASDHMSQIYLRDVMLNTQQKDEYLKMNLLINSLAMADDILEKGCVMRLRYARYGEKFINSDAPVILLNSPITRLEEHAGCIPLSPRLLMNIDRVGCSMKIHKYSDIKNIEVEALNHAMIKNADEFLYFSSNNQRNKYMNSMFLNV